MVLGSATNTTTDPNTQRQQDETLLLYTTTVHKLLAPFRLRPSFTAQGGSPRRNRGPAFTIPSQLTVLTTVR